MKSLKQFIKIIETIAAHPSLTNTQLSKALKIQPYNLSRYLSVAIGSGWITKIDNKFYIGQYFDRFKIV